MFLVSHTVIFKVCVYGSCDVDFACFVCWLRNLKRAPPMSHGEIDDQNEAMEDLVCDLKERCTEAGAPRQA